MQDYTLLTKDEQETLVKKAIGVAFQTEFDHGNCIQSTLNGIYTAFPDYGITEDVLKGCFGIAGGCGCSLLGTCGALNAAAWAIGMCYGRPIDDLNGDYEDCHRMIRDLIAEFKEKYDGILCSEVLTHNLGAPYDWNTEEGYAGYREHNGTFHCASVVAYCTEKIARMIINGKLQH